MLLPSDQRDVAGDLAIAFVLDRLVKRGNAAFAASGLGVSPVDHCGDRLIGFGKAARIFLRKGSVGCYRGRAHRNTARKGNGKGKTGNGSANGFRASGTEGAKHIVYLS